MANLGEGGVQRHARHGVVRWAMAGLLATGVLATSGCALPGYSSDAMDSGSWYSFGGNDSAATDWHAAIDTRSARVNSQTQP